MLSLLLLFHFQVATLVRFRFSYSHFNNSSETRSIVHGNAGFSTIDFISLINSALLTGRHP